jgi:hypothetical protein
MSVARLDDSSIVATWFHSVDRPHAGWLVLNTTVCVVLFAAVATSTTLNPIAARCVEIFAVFIAASMFHGRFGRDRVSIGAERVVKRKPLGIEWRIDRRTIERLVVVEREIGEWAGAHRARTKKYPVLCAETRDGKLRDVATEDRRVIAYLARLFEACGFAVESAGL